jgi:hypothetical protein
MDGYLKLTELDGEDVTLAVKYVSIDNISTAMVEEGSTVLVMNNKDTIRIPNTENNPFFVDASGALSPSAT